MKKITLLICALFLFFSPLYAQVTVSLGTPTGASSTNVLLSTSTTSNRYSRTISIYTASEIISAGGMNGTISKLAWDKQGSGEYTTADAYIKIYLKHLTNNTWTSVPDWNTQIVGATEVFTSSTYSIPTGTGWKEVNFTNSFSWNGVDNIAVLVEWDRSSTPTAAINWGRSTTPSTNATRVGSSSLSGLQPFLINDNRPLLQLTINSGTTTCASPSFITLDYLTTTTAGFLWNPSPDETGGYKWEVYLAGDTPGTDLPVTTGNVATGTLGADVTGLMSNVNYEFYVKTVCTSSESMLAGPLSFTTLEECNSPTNIQFTNITETTASFSWDASLDESGGYEWEIYEGGDIPGTDPSIADGITNSGVNTETVTGLTSNTNYDFYIRTICTANESSFEGPFNFSTEANCAAPTNIQLTNVTETTVSFSWDVSQDESGGYEWEIYEAGDIPGTDPSVTDGITNSGVNMETVSGLTNNTNYDFYIRTICATNESNFEGPLNFLTDDLGVNDEFSHTIQFYPNPTENFIHLSGKTTLENVVVFTLNGQKLVDKTPNKSNFNLDISNLTSGIYFMRVSSDSKSKTFKIIKQ